MNLMINQLGEYPLCYVVVFASWLANNLQLLLYHGNLLLLLLFFDIYV